MVSYTLGVFNLEQRVLHGFKSHPTWPCRTCSTQEIRPGPLRLVYTVAYPGHSEEGMPISNIFDQEGAKLNADFWNLPWDGRWRDGFEKMIWIGTAQAQGKHFVNVDYQNAA